MLNLAVVGATGRMGKALVQAIDAREDSALSLATVESGSASLGRDAGLEAGIAEQGIALGDALTADFDVLIDFTVPEATLEHLAFCVEQGKPMVIGTTGLNKAQLEQLQSAAKSIPVCFAANYSTGVTLCLALARQAARVMAADSDIEIYEAHHRHKVDSPSGTALALGHAITDELGWNPDEAFVLERQGITGARPDDSIGFSVFRGGDVVGDHTVTFAAEGERVEITHKASSRQSFARGALRAAHWLRQQPAGLYDMRDVLGI